MVWSQTTETGDPAQVSAVLEMAGWPDDIREQVVRPRR
jgi:hypothetical protein